MTTNGRSRFGEPADRGDLVERLVPLAEPGPEVPAAGAERIRSATRPLWRREVARRRVRRRLAWTGGGLAAAALLGVMLRWGAGTPAPEARVVATVAAVEGALRVVSGPGAERTVTPGDLGVELGSGSRLLTGETGRAALILSGGQSLRMDRSSEVRLGAALVVVLERGGLYVDSEDGHDGTVEVRTRLGVARDVGTQFEVRMDDGTLTVRVREGTVVLTRDDAVLQIARGAGLRVDAGGRPQGIAVSLSGPEWQWVQEVAPSFEIEGRTALAFLDWVSRETGLRVSFADPGLETLARETVLHGTIEDLAPGQAAQVVLPGCGLEADRRDGRLVVRRLGDGG